MVGTRATGLLSPVERQVVPVFIRYQATSQGAGYPSASDPTSGAGARIVASEAARGRGGVAHTALHPSGEMDASGTFAIESDGSGRRELRHRGRRHPASDTSGDRISDDSRDRRDDRSPAEQLSDGRTGSRLGGREAGVTAAHVIRYHPEGLIPSVLRQKRLRTGGATARLPATAIQSRSSLPGVLRSRARLIERSVRIASRRNPSRRHGRTEGRDPWNRPAMAR